MLDIRKINSDLQCKTELTRFEFDVIKEMYLLLNGAGNLGGDSFKLWKKDSLFIYGDVDKMTTVNNKVKPELLFDKYNILYDEKSKVSTLLFSIQTFYSVLIKFVAASMICDDLTFDLIDMLSGKIFINSGLLNYCYEDYYCWFLNDNYIKHKINDFKLFLQENYVNNTEDVSFLNNDYVKQIYETVIPKEFRHILGEYYTPDWMAQYTINESLRLSQREISDDITFLDPTCGSGTFIFKCLERVSPKALLSGNVRGYDINPLAVLTSRTNYLISAIRKGIFSFNNFVIPVFCYDTINTPLMRDGKYIINLNFENDFLIDSELFETEKGIHEIETIKSLTVTGKERLNSAIIFPEEYYSLDAAAKLCVLNALENRILGSRLSKNDFVVGNPPWVNWEYLPEQYKRRSNYMWYDYGLFDAKGRDLSFSKEDISVLISYVVLDKYLKKEGFLGFVVRQVMFKSASNGVSFRKFYLENSSTYLKVHKVDDMSKVKVFDNATNSTSIMFIQRDNVTNYPVDYCVWNKTKTKFNSYSDLCDVLSATTRDMLIANPAISDDITSMWTTIDSELVDLTKTILGVNKYKARTGIFTGGANAVYWVRIIKEVDDNHVLIENIVERAKRKADVYQAVIEKGLLYPMAQGSTIDTWNCSNNIYLICPHSAETKMKPLEIETMKNDYPMTYDYLLHFKEFLDERNGFAGWEKELQKQYFYSILRIGDYTFSKYKVGWKYIATEFISCVFSSTDDPYLGEKYYLPNEKVMYVSLDNELEAYYLCGILSSKQVSTVIKSYMNPTSISAHVLEKVFIPEFNEKNPLHIQISNACKEGHDPNKHLESIDRINALVNELYGLSSDVLEKLN